MRRSALVALLSLFASPAFAEKSELKLLDCTHLMAWTAGGISTRRLQHMVGESGIGFTPTEATIKLLIRVGASQNWSVLYARRNRLHQPR